MTIEICTDDLHTALLARAAGADRIELCGHLAAGGTTPSQALIEQVCSQSGLPVMVMIRPRAGNFVYSKAEVALMKRECQLAIEAGATGLVWGVLTPEMTIDTAIAQELIAMSNGLPITFHRAFDLVNNYEKALDQLMELNIPRLLTSGLAGTAPEGQSVIKALVEQAAGRISILAGSGINASNVLKLVAHTGVQEIHFSGSSMQSPATFSAPAGLGAVEEYPVFLAEKIQNIRKLFPQQ